MKATTRSALGAMVLISCIGQPWDAGASTKSWRYVVPPVQSADTFELPSPAPAFAPFGEVSIVPDGTSVTVTIEDDVNPDGSFLFKICQRNTAQAGDYYCGPGGDDVSTGDICYTGPETLAGVVPGNPVEVTLWWAPSPCPDAPTTGTLTVES